MGVGVNGLPLHHPGDHLRSFIGSTRHRAGELRGFYSPSASAVVPTQPEVPWCVAGRINAAARFAGIGAGWVGGGLPDAASSFRDLPGLGLTGFGQPDRASFHLARGESADQIISGKEISATGT